MAAFPTEKKNRSIFAKKGPQDKGGKPRFRSKNKKKKKERLPPCPQSGAGQRRKKCQNEKKRPAERPTHFSAPLASKKKLQKRQELKMRHGNFRKRGASAKTSTSIEKKGGFKVEGTWEKWGNSTLKKLLCLKRKRGLNSGVLG